MSHDVFICYSSKDKKVADAACDSLERQGVQCWIAPRNVSPSIPYARAITVAIETCRLVVLVFSDDANHSPHVEREVGLASNKNKSIVPFKIENVPFSKELEYSLGNLHWLDASSPPMEGRISELSKAVAQLLADGGNPRSESGPSFDQQAGALTPKTTPILPKTKGLLLVIVLLVIAIFGYFLWKYHDNENTFEAMVVRDHAAKVIWTKTDRGKDTNLDEAEAFCNTMKLGNLTWQLPSIDQLKALYDPNRTPKIREPFQLTGYWVWSSTKSNDGDGRQAYDFRKNQIFDYHRVIDYGSGRAFCVARSEP